MTNLGHGEHTFGIVDQDSPLCPIQAESPGRRKGKLKRGLQVAFLVRSFYDQETQGWFSKYELPTDPTLIS